MKNVTPFLILFLLVGVLLTGANYIFKPFKDSTFWQPKATPTSTSSPEVEPTDLELILEQMTPAQKISQLLAVPVGFDELASTSADVQESIQVAASIGSQSAVSVDRTATVAASTVTASQSAVSNKLAWIAARQPGLITIFGTNISLETAKNRVQLLNSFFVDQPTLPLIATDHEGGDVQRFTGTGFNRLASWQELCTLEEADLRASLAASAAQLKEAGVDIVFGPVLDYGRNHPYLKTRVCNASPSIVVEKATAAITAYQDNNIYPVVKHFPGLGKSTKDLHEVFDAVAVDQTDADIYLSILKVFPDIGVMVSHVGVTNQFSTIPCSLSKSCVDQLHQQHPDIIVFSDALEMGAALGVGSVAQRTLPEASYAALIAGNDVLVYGQGVSSDQLEEVYQYLLAKYETEASFRQIIEKKVALILDLKRAVEILE